jgi:hypothetical protein
LNDLIRPAEIFGEQTETVESERLQAVTTASRSQPRGERRNRSFLPAECGDPVRCPKPSLP